MATYLDDKVIPKPGPSELGMEQGSSLAGLPFSQQYLGADGELLRIAKPTIRQLVDMRHHDGQARALYNLITLPVRAAFRRLTWVTPDGDKGETDFVKKLLTLPPSAGGMRTPLRTVVAQMLTGCFDGFSAFELVPWSPRKGVLKGKYTIQKLAYRPSETVTFVVTDSGDLKGLRQRSAGMGGRVIDVTIDAKKVIYFAAQAEDSPFYGQSYFSSAFYAYDKKCKMMYLAGLTAQHHALGTRVGKYPKSASPKDRQAFKAALSNFGLAQVMTIPAEGGWEVSGESGRTSFFPFMDYINHYNSQMSKSVLAPFFDNAQGGEKALVDFGGQSDTMFLVLEEALMNEIEAVFNEQVIPRFIDWNFGSGRYPEVKLGPFTDEQRKAINDTFDKLATAGTGSNVTREFLLQIEKHMAQEMGLEIDYKKFEDAMKGEEKAVLKHMKSGSQDGPTLQQPPFAPTPTVPADQQAGVPANQQWIPGGPVGTPPGGQPPDQYGAQPQDQYGGQPQDSSQGYDQGGQDNGSEWPTSFSSVDAALVTPDDITQMALAHSGLSSEDAALIEACVTDVSLVT